MNSFLGWFVGQDAIINYLLEYIIGAAVIAITGIMFKHLGVRIDEKRQADLKAAIKTVVMAIVARWGKDVFDAPKNVDVISTAEVLREVKKSVPQAAKHYGLDKEITSEKADVVDNLVKAAVKQVIDETVKAGADAVIASGGKVIPPPKVDPRHVTQRT